MSRVRKSGGYRELRSFQTATIIYDATYWFCEKFVDLRSRTADQMVQAGGRTSPRVRGLRQPRANQNYGW